MALDLRLPEDPEEVGLFWGPLHLGQDLLGQELVDSIFLLPD